ncbi:hypothetical protein [Shewanella sp. SR44-3]|uniref:hypothetical protein n=1 Tax=unclassified Shewanella TaxID=196818 RepID=UPI0015FCC373|nr:hypothetical protein [Shewanella sp. SR44-3]MBB1268582.1 hypothetical protein [Shewanella sp. SR44-3]
MSISHTRLSNADRWSELCDKQIAVLDRLSASFPERSEQIAALSHTWEVMQQQVNEGKSMHSLAL